MMKNAITEVISDIEHRGETTFGDEAAQRRTFVDPWPGPDHTNWGQDIKPDAAGK